MLQILGVILFITGVATIAAPVKVSVGPQNKKRIAAGQEPMTEEEFVDAVKKARTKGILTAIGGVVLFSAATFIGAMATVFLG